MVKERKYYDTVQMKSGTNGKDKGEILLVYVSKKWPIPTNSKVWFTIRGIDEDPDDETRVRKILRRSGTGRKIVCNRIWGYKEGDWVVFSVQKATDDECGYPADGLDDGNGDQETD